MALGDWVYQSEPREGGLQRERAGDRRAGGRRKDFSYESRRRLFGGRGGMRSQCLQASIAVLSVVPNKDSSHVHLTSGLACRSVYMQRHEELTDATAGMNQKDDSVIQARD